jgi:hypothetical protein
VRGDLLEIGWRIHPGFWHRGLATEADARLVVAKTALYWYRRFGFEVWVTERGTLIVAYERQDEHHMVCRAHLAP